MLPAAAELPARRFWQQVRRDRAGTAGFGLLAVITLAAVLGPLLLSGDPGAPHLEEAFLSPGLRHPLGTDHLGRDLLVRIVYGARVSLLTAAGALGLGLLVGVPVGLVAGTARGAADEVLMGATEVLMSFPGALLAILAVAVLGPGIRNVVLAVGVASTPVFARLVRGVALGLREREFVEAARALGASGPRIVAQHILPGCLAPIVVAAMLRLGVTIVTVAGLGFLGLGGDPATPEWGAMLSQGQEFLRRAPHIAMAPGLAILLVVLSVNLAGDALADALDPRVRAQRAAG
ncbi:MAG: ABC transporter permease [Armatimonadota bacterium]|nr:ABC transporter permease [Armatimonadota bacterium]MDR7532665.1 ABC transporter permease [Armatimonadota bacterium]MDR7536316.1 ABC transporter permease [Armatimonadota bacterium]